MTTNKAAVSGDINAAVTAERARVREILLSPEGKLNPELANELAVEHGLDAALAISILAKAPSTATPYYLAAMAREGGINLGATTAEFQRDPKAERMAEISASMATFNEARGYNVKVAR